MSNKSAPFFNFLVILSSALLGFLFPEGWLWHKIIDEANFSIACFKIILISITVPETPPWLIFDFSIIRFDLFNNKIQNSSWGRSPSIGWNSSNISLLCVIFFFVIISETFRHFMFLLLADSHKWGMIGCEKRRIPLQDWPNHGVRFKFAAQKFSYCLPVPSFWVVKIRVEA